MPFLLVLLVVNLFILPNPLLLVAVDPGNRGRTVAHGIAFWVCLPLTVWMWYLIVRFWRRSRGL